MKPSIYRRIRRRSASHETANANKESKQEQSFFGEASHETFFQPTPVVQRKCENCEEEEKVQRQPEKKEEEKKVMRVEDKKEEEKIQKKEDLSAVAQAKEDKKEEDLPAGASAKEGNQIQKKETNSTASTGKSTRNYISSISGKGNPLPANANQFFSSKMGYDFSNVKIHTDKEAVASAKDVNAKAYTVGNNVVFNEGQFNTESSEGKKLMAHELTHVLQQKKIDGGLIQRKEPKAIPKPTAADAPKLKLIKNDPKACALLLVIHNDEENAKRIANAIAANCSYNLLLLEPGSKRNMKIPGNGSFDPNGLFPPEIAQLCYNKPSECDDFLTAKATSNDPADILKYVQIQFFMSIRKYSNGFSIPVVALHNNSIDDTKKFRAKKDKVGINDLKKDLEKENPETDEEPAKQLKEQLDKKFKVDTKKELMTKGKTNIFLWCASKDITKCHIGDPDNPDHVIWVTNDADYNKLKLKNVNVAYQDRVPKSADSKSLTDLSTLFPNLNSIQTILYMNVLHYIINWINSIPLISDSIKFDLMIKAHIDVLNAWTAASQKLRYVNIETPGLKTSDRTDTERVGDFKYIADVLKSLGIYCCGDDPTSSEAKIEESLKTKETKK